MIIGVAVVVVNGVVVVCWRFALVVIVCVDPAVVVASGVVWAIDEVEVVCAAEVNVGVPESVVTAVVTPVVVG